VRDIPLSGQGLLVVCVILVGGAAACTRWALDCRVIDAGFWFEPVTYQSARLGGAVTPQEIATIVAVARSEIIQAFADLSITFSSRRDAKYRVRVVPQLRDMRVRWEIQVPAESRSVAGFGGQGAVNFFWMANAAVAYAPDTADRRSIIDAIGRGIGRAAVHEFAHLLLPRAPIDDSKDINSYEYRSAARREQYFGELHWGRVRPLLVDRIPPCAE
jgi:hypothetical protein